MIEWAKVALNHLHKIDRFYNWASRKWKKIKSKMEFLPFVEIYAQFIINVSGEQKISIVIKADAPVTFYNIGDPSKLYKSHPDISIALHCITRRGKRHIYPLIVKRQCRGENDTITLYPRHPWIVSQLLPNLDWQKFMNIPTGGYYLQDIYDRKYPLRYKYVKLIRNSCCN